VTVEIRESPLDELFDFLNPIATAFGFTPLPEVTERLGALPEYEFRLVACEGEEIVGAAGSFLFDLTTPGGSVPTGGLTQVGVLPTHRRRGILRELMRRYLDDVRGRGHPVSALWASEGQIYGRFGYGLASLCGQISLERRHAEFAEPRERRARTRLVDEDEAAELFPPVWEEVRSVVPGMLSRTEDWWAFRRLEDSDWNRRGRGPLQRVALELDDRPAGYALYRLQQGWEDKAPTGSVDVTEAMGDSPEATRELWRFLAEIDAYQTLKASLLPVDHPLHLLLAQPRRARMRLADALWVRIVDVPAALAARVFADTEPLVVELEDAFCPWNEGRWRIGPDGTERTEAEPDLRCDAAALGSVYLGGFAWGDLVEGLRVAELRKGAAARADALFVRGRAPWCPEIF
jgi:predicted acetyltransferase